MSNDSNVKLLILTAMEEETMHLARHLPPYNGVQTFKDCDVKKLATLLRILMINISLVFNTPLLKDIEYQLLNRVFTVHDEFLAPFIKVHVDTLYYIRAKAIELLRDLWSLQSYVLQTFEFDPRSLPPVMMLSIYYSAKSFIESQKRNYCYLSAVEEASSVIANDATKKLLNGLQVLIKRPFTQESLDTFCEGLRSFFVFMNPLLGRRYYGHRQVNAVALAVLRCYGITDFSLMPKDSYNQAFELYAGAVLSERLRLLVEMLGCPLIGGRVGRLSVQWLDDLWDAASCYLLHVKFFLAMCDNISSLVNFSEVKAVADDSCLVKIPEPEATADVSGFVEVPDFEVMLA